MAKSKEDIKYGTAQAKLSEDEALRTGYWNGTPLESGKIADSGPVDLLSAAHNISTSKDHDESAAGGGRKETDQRETNRNNLAASLLPPPPVGEPRGTSG